MTFQVRQHNMSLNFSGFRVGTKLGGQNVISDFDIVADWASKSDSMASQTMTDVGMDFFLESAESITLIAANVISEPDGLMKAKLDGMVVRNLISHGSVVLEPGISYHVRIAFNCLEQAKVNMTLMLEFDGDLPRLAIPWEKICGGVDSTSLTIITEIADGNTSVVMRGRPQWTESTVVDEATSSTSFLILHDKESLEQSSVISAPRVQAKGVCVAMIDSSIKANTSVTINNPENMTLKYMCMGSGSCVLSVEVPLYPEMAPYKPIDRKSVV